MNSRGRPDDDHDCGQRVGEVQGSSRGEEEGPAERQCANPAPDAPPGDLPTAVQNSVDKVRLSTGGACRYDGQVMHLVNEPDVKDVDSLPSCAQVVYRGRKRRRGEFPGPRSWSIVEADSVGRLT